MTADEARKLAAECQTTQAQATVSAVVVFMEIRIQQAALSGQRKCSRPKFRDLMKQETLEEASRILADRGFITSVCNGILTVEW